MRATHAKGLTRRPGAHNRCFGDPAEEKKQPRNSSLSDRYKRQTPLAFSASGESCLRTQVRRAHSFSIARIPAPHNSDSSRRTSKHSKLSKQSALLLPRASPSQSCQSAAQAGFRSRCVATTIAAPPASSRILRAATHQYSRCTRSCYPAASASVQASRPQAFIIASARRSPALPTAGECTLCARSAAIASSTH